MLAYSIPYDDMVKSQNYSYLKCYLYSTCRDNRNHLQIKQDKDSLNPKFHPGLAFLFAY